MTANIRHIVVEEIPVHIVHDKRPANYAPLFSVVIALYNAEKYFRATITSLKKQKIARDKLEFIIVDDGSDDASLEIAARWARQDPRVVVATKENQGIGHTRLVAQKLARGTWVTAVDPDDIVAPEYFSEVEKMMSIDVDDAVALYSSRVFITNDLTGRLRDTHPLGKKFSKGNRFVSLQADPSAIQMGATCFLRRSVLQENAIYFDTRVKPTYEDGHLVGRYLCHFDDPLVGLVATAHYYYRKRADGSSAVQSGWSDSAKYDAQLRFGYLGMLQYAQGILGFIPDWMATMVLYDLMWYFKEYQNFHSANQWLGEHERTVFLALCDQIFAFLTSAQLKNLQVNRPNWALQEALLLGMGMEALPARLWRWSTDEQRRTEYSLLLRADAGKVVTYVNGVEREVALLGVTEHEFFGRLMMRECSIQVPEGDFSVWVDGIPIREHRKEKETCTALSHAFADSLTEKARPLMLRRSLWDKRLDRLRVESLIRGVSFPGLVVPKGLRAVRRGVGAVFHEATGGGLGLKAEVDVLDARIGGEFEGAWLILDRPNSADDNGEHLYRFLAQHRRDIPVFFVIDKNSKDWHRLEHEGFRLIDYSSHERIVAARHARVVASSDAVVECMNLIPPGLGQRKYKFIFLQHGVCDKDLSAWLRHKAIDLTICSLRPEYEDFAWNKSRYQASSKRLALTGIARHDQLQYLNGQRRVGSHDGCMVLTVMPTWRRELKEALDDVRSQEEKKALLCQSNFITTWVGVLKSRYVYDLVSAGRLKIRFVAHPNLAPFVKAVDIPPYVDLMSSGQESFQDMLVNTDVFLTDYSSVAFDAAYIGKAVGYYQFDRAELLQGKHSWVPGYFDWLTMGLGPVFEEQASVEQWIGNMLSTHARVPAEFEERSNMLFAYRDTRNCQRITAAIEAVLKEDYDALVPTVINGGQKPTLTDYLNVSVAGEGTVQ